MVKLFRQISKIVTDSWAIVISFPRTFLIAFLCTTITGLLEGLSIATMLPTISSIAGPSSINETSGPAKIVKQLMNGIGLEVNLVNLLMAILLMTCLKSVFAFVARIVTGYISADLAEALRERYLDALLGVTWGYYTSAPLGKTNNALAAQCEHGARVVLAISELASSCYLTVVYIAMSFWISWEVTLIALVFGGLISQIIRLFTIRIHKAAKEKITLLSGMNSRLNEIVTGIKQIKSMGLESSIVPNLRSEIKKLSLNAKTVCRLKALNINVVEPIKVLVLCIIVFLMIHGLGLSLGASLLVIFVFSRISGSLVSMNNSIQTYMVFQASYAFINREIEQLVEKREPNDGLVFNGNRSFDIEFKGVTFGYSGGSNVFNKFSFRIKPHTLTCIVGPSGVGKTTLVDLLLGFYPVVEGEIIVCGQKISEVNIESYRKAIGYVPQESFLFNETVERNVSFGEASFGEDEIWKALKLAGLDEQIRAKPLRLNTNVGERGLQFSGGQRQRLSIARALVRKPGLLILDEATSALDSKTANVLCERLVLLRKYVTVVAVTHNHDMSKYADQVIDLSQEGSRNQ